MRLLLLLLLVVHRQVLAYQDIRGEFLCREVSLFGNELGELVDYDSPVPKRCLMYDL